MNPIFKHLQKPVAGVIVQQMRPSDEKPEADDQSAAIEACASELIRAVHAKDTKAVANAMADAFQILDSMPHEESNDTPSPHTYDHQNQKAAE